MTHAANSVDPSVPGSIQFNSKFDVLLTVHHSIDFFQITNLMHNSFILSRPYLRTGPRGPGPRWADFQGRHIKKIEIEVWYAGGKKSCPRERDL